MANEWCRRVQHFYNIFKAEGGDLLYRFTVDQVQSYEEKDIFRLEVETWPAEDRVLQRKIAELRRKKPRVG